MGKAVMLGTSRSRIQ